METQTDKSVHVRGSTLAIYRPLADLLGSVASLGPCCLLPLLFLLATPGRRALFATRLLYPRNVAPSSVHQKTFVFAKGAADRVRL